MWFIVIRLLPVLGFMVLLVFCLVEDSGIWPEGVA